MVRHRTTSLLSLCLAAGFSLEAQSLLTINGTVHDPSGAQVPSVLVELDKLGGLVAAQTLTSLTGTFTLPAVHPGDYTLLIPAANGFAAQSIALHLTRQPSPLQIKLTTGTVSQNVTVTAAPTLSIDPAANRDTVAVTGASLKKLPVFDHNYIATLTPFLDASSSTTAGITVVVDGVEMKSAGVSASAIQEVRINNDPYTAESNRPGRGRIEIMTKPGSPDFHGELNFLFRDSVFNASNFFSPTKPTEHRTIVEGHLTGPIGHGGHTTFMLTGNLANDNTYDAVHAINLAGPINLNAATPSADQSITARIAHDTSPNHRIALQYNFDLSSDTNGNVGGLTLPEAGYNASEREDDLVFNDRLIITPNLLNQFQLTLEKDADTQIAATHTPSIQVSDSFIGGGTAEADMIRTENSFHANDILSWTHGNHYIRFGPQLPQISRRVIEDHTNRNGTFQFASLTTYAAGTPDTYTVQQGTGRGIYWFNQIGAFFQDQIKLTPQLQLSLGVRWDWQTYLPDDNNFAPRVSLAWSPKKLHNTVFSTGSGVFYDRIGPGAIGPSKIENGVTLDTVQIINPSYPTPIAPGTSFAGLPTNIAQFDPHVRTPYTIQSSAGIESQLAPHLTVTADYRVMVGIGIFRSRDINAPLGPLYLVRPNPALGEVDQYESRGRRFANFLDLGLNGSIGRWFTGQAQYTLTSNHDNTSGIYFFPQDQTNPNAEWGRADTDIRQHFNLLGNINPDHWLTLGIAAEVSSGTPYTETSGTDSYNTGLGNARPPGVGRNTLQGAGSTDIDLLWDHDFVLGHPKDTKEDDDKDEDDNTKTLNIGISAYNIFNHPNFDSYVGSIGSPLFGQPVAALSARELEFTVGYKF